ncbi:MAG: hypothetical protein HN730_09155 [Bdellovibrionales bacterium]|nr:hypothetical protein [Bdellovibrionales bacterium]
MSTGVAMATSDIDHRKQQQYEKELHHRVRSNLVQYLGESVQFTLFINAIAVEKKQLDLSVTGEKKESYSKISIPTIIDVGYLEVPQVINDNYARKFFASAVKQVETLVYLYSELDNDTISGMESIIRSTIAPIKSKIEFNHLPAPFLNTGFEEPLPFGVDQHPQIAAAAGTPAGESVLPSLLNLFGMLALAAALVGGVYLFVQSMNRPLLSLAKSIEGHSGTGGVSSSELDKTVRDSIRSSIREAVDGSIKEAGVPTLKEPKSEGPSDNPIEANYQAVAKESERRNMDFRLKRNIISLNNVVTNAPFLLISNLSESDGDYLGVKKLLPLLVHNNSKTISKIIPEAALEKVERMTQDKPTMSEGEFDKWLSSFVEKLTLSYLKEGNFYSKLLSKDSSATLYQLKGEELFAAARNMDSGVAMKLAIDFAGEELSAELLATLDSEQWELILEDKTTDAKVIQGVAQELCSIVRKRAQVTDQSRSLEDSVNRVLLSPVVNFLHTKDIGDDESFIQRIERVAPKFAKRVRSKVWTSSIFRHIPHPFMRQVMTELSTSDRFFLLLGVPRDITDYLLCFIPMGKERAELKEQLLGATANKIPQQQTQATNYAKRFISYLRDANAQGAFILTGDPLSFATTEVPAGLLAKLKERKDRRREQERTDQFDQSRKDWQEGNFDQEQVQWLERKTTLEQYEQASKEFLEQEVVVSVNTLEEEMAQAVFGLNRESGGQELVQEQVQESEAVVALKQSSEDELAPSDPEEMFDYTEEEEAASDDDKKEAA